MAATTVKKRSRTIAYYPSSGVEYTAEHARSARSKLDKQDYIDEIDRMSKQLEDNLRASGGRIGPATTIEVIGKLAMFGLALEYEDRPNFRRNRTWRLLATRLKRPTPKRL